MLAYERDDWWNSGRALMISSRNIRAAIIAEFPFVSPLFFSLSVETKPRNNRFDLFFFHHEKQAR